MLIKCEKCGAVFNVDDSVQFSDGQKLVCSACDHTWTWHAEKPAKAARHAKTEKAEPTKEHSKHKPEAKEIIAPRIDLETEFETDTNLSIPDEFKPVKKQKKSHKLLWFLLILLLLALTALVGFKYLDPALIFSDKSARPAKPRAPLPLAELEIVDTSFRLVPVAEGTDDLRMLVQGALYNPGDTTSRTRSFWIELYDDAGQIVYESEITPIQTRILPRGSLPFYAEINPVPENVKRMDIVFR